jgi:hypothetical protein
VLDANRVANMSRPTLVKRALLTDIAAAQDDVISRRQLAALGYDRDAVRAQIAARRWQVAGNRVIVLHNGPLTVAQHRWAAVLSQHNSALAGLTAAAEHGLTGFDHEAVHLLVPFGTRITANDGVRIHVSRRFSANDIHPARRIPSVRIERALVDAASWTPWPRKACAVLAAGVQQRLTTAERLRPELLLASRAKHHGLLSQVVGDIEGGADSFAEIDLGWLARRAGVPPPRRQVFRYDAAGRRRWLDADFDGFSVEVDGAVHLKPLRYWDDMERQNDLIIVTGKPMLRFATVAIRLLPLIVIGQLAAAHDRFGTRRRER